MKFLGITQQKEDKPKKSAYYTNLEGNPAALAQNDLNLKKRFNIKKYTHIRLSELATFCPREYALGYKYGKARESYTEYPLMQQFEIGSALHFWYQNFSKVFKDVLYGYWKCWACGKLRGKDTPFFGTRAEVKNKPCEHCGASGDATFYHEYYFRIDEPYRVVGKLDGFILKENKIHVIDLKTYFTKDNFPKLQDKAQLIGYMLFSGYISKEYKIPYPVNLEIGYLYYISKKFSYSESILAYPVEKNPKIVNPILKNVSAFSNSVKTGILPDPFDTCVRSDWKKGKAKKCYLSDLCRELFISGKI